MAFVRKYHRSITDSYSLFHSLGIPAYSPNSLWMLSCIFLEKLQTVFEKVSQEQHWVIPCFTPWSFPITLSFPVYLPLALRCYQVYFWRNCRRLLPKSGKISQEHHWQQECQEPFELSYATGRQSFPIDSSLLPQSEIGKRTKNILLTVCTVQPNSGLSFSFGISYIFMFVCI